MWALAFVCPRVAWLIGPLALLETVCRLLVTMGRVAPPMFRSCRAPSRRSSLCGARHRGHVATAKRISKAAPLVGPPLAGCVWRRRSMMAYAAQSPISLRRQLRPRRVGQLCVPLVGRARPSESGQHVHQREPVLACFAVRFAQGFNIFGLARLVFVF